MKSRIIAATPMPIPASAATERPSFRLGFKLLVAVGMTCVVAVDFEVAAARSELRNLIWTMGLRNSKPST